MIFTLLQMRQNRKDNRRWQALVEQMEKDMQAAREQRHELRHERYEIWQQRCQAEREECHARYAELRQQFTELLAQNQQLMGMLLDLLERGSDSAAAPSD